MKTWIFTGILSALFVLALCAAASAQCPGGVCAKQATKSVLKATTKVVQKATVKERLTVRKVRLFRRWR